MKQIILIISFFAVSVSQVLAQTVEVPFTLEDRDRIMRTEEKVESLRNEMNARFEGMDAKLGANNSKFEPLYWMIGLVFALMLFMFGYMIWDRRTALHPLQKNSYKHDERLNRLENITREQAKRDPSFAEVLRAAGLL